MLFVNVGTMLQINTDTQTHCSNVGAMLQTNMLFVNVGPMSRCFLGMAPSQPCAPPSHQTLPVYTFQCICSDFFTYKGISYLVSVDRYSNWPIVERSTGGAQGLIASLRQLFGTFGIAEELSSDSGPEFSSAATQTFLRSMGVHHRLSSVAYLHSNRRAEIGVKTLKRLIGERA